MALPDPQHSWALLIGTSRYPSELENLPAVEQNLKDLRRVLTDRRLGGLRPDHCNVILNPGDQRTVAGALDQLGQRATDTLIIYYAGHGLLDDSTSLHLGLTTSTPRLVVADSMPFEVVRVMLRRSRARARILILDCCYSGRAIGTMGAASELAAGQVAVDGTYTLTSSAATRASLAPPGSRLTAFTGELLRLLRQGRPSGPPELDMHSIYLGLKESLATRGLPEPQQRVDNTAHHVALVKNVAWVPYAQRPPGPAAIEVDPTLVRPSRRRFPKRTLLSAAWLDQVVAWAPLDGRHAGIEGTYTLHLPDRNQTFSFVIDDNGHLTRAYLGGSAKATASTTTTPAQIVRLLRPGGGLTHNEVLRQRNYPLWLFGSVAPTRDSVDRFTRWPRGLIAPRRTARTIRPRRAALTALSVITLEIASVVGLVQNLPSGRAVDTSLTAATVGPNGVVSALQNERDWAMAEQLGVDDVLGGPIEGYEASRAWTDRALTDLRRVMPGVADSVVQDFEQALREAETIGQIRREVDSVSAPPDVNNLPRVVEISEKYTRLVAQFLDPSVRAPEDVDDADLRSHVRVSRLASQQIETLFEVETVVFSSAALSSNGLDTADEIEQVRAVQSTFQQFADRLASRQDDYDDVVAHELSEAVESINELIDTAVSTDTLEFSSWLDVRDRALKEYIDYRTAVDSTMRARAEDIDGESDARRLRAALLALAVLVGAAISVRRVLHLRATMRVRQRLGRETNGTPPRQSVTQR